ncbi:MAG: ATP--guanido phosphotransferase [Planctomycetota bacterium]|nr:ATP--guanido phosphotransferase [Planctomycetota bacterium]
MNRPKDEVAALASTPVPWLASPGEHDGIVLASRIRLARNAAGWRFARRLSNAQTRDLVEQLAGAIDSVLPGRLLRIDKLSPVQRRVLIERHLISLDLAGSERASGLWLGSDGGRTAIMIGEEDHIRLQVFAPGLALERLLREAIAIDRRLESRIPWAFDERFGYLTACHSNVGTGLRASVMLHLPALATLGELKPILRGLEQLHLAVRGRFGEGSEPQGHYYQISNRRTLGLDEATIVATVTEAAQRVIEGERLARQAMLDDEQRRTQLEDRVHRAWGIISHARTLSGEELTEHLGWLRVGLSLRLPPFADSRLSWTALDHALIAGQPGHIMLTQSHAEDTVRRDRLRADLVRSWLMGGNNDVRQVH